MTSNKRSIHSEFVAPKPVKEKTLPEYYLARAKEFAEQGRSYWMVDGLTDEKRYFSKFEEETRKIASAFYKLGLRKGDVVIYMIRDLSRTYILFTGVWRANGIMRASYPDDDFKTILPRVKESKAKFIVCEEEAVDLCKKIADAAEWDVNVITVNRTSSDLKSIEGILEEDDGLDCPELDINEEDFAIILSTSGTTGLPKGAVHTHRSYLFHNRVYEQIAWTLEKPNLVATKATHITGTMVGFALLGSGKTAVVVSNPTQENIFNVAAKYKPGLVFAFPTLLVALAGPAAKDYDFTSIEMIFSGGVPVTPAIYNTILKIPNVKDIVLAYGLTEAVICTTSGILKEDHERETPSIRNLPGFSVGRPYSGTELQIRDPKTLEVLGPHQKGEICVKSPAMFHSYLNNPEATEKAFVDGYFRTGDIGYYDETGLVFLVDRLKEIFKYFNDHISPTELESAIGKHPAVNEVSVIGLPDPGGHVPRAFVTVHPNSGDRKILAEEIKAFANANLAPYKQLRGGLYIVDELPKGKTGKITRQLVEKLPLPY